MKCVSIYELICLTQPKINCSFSASVVFVYFILLHLSSPCLFLLFLFTVYWVFYRSQAERRKGARLPICLINEQDRSRRSSPYSLCPSLFDGNDSSSTFFYSTLTFTVKLEHKSYSLNYFIVLLAVILYANVITSLHITPNVNNLLKAGQTCFVIEIVSSAPLLFICHYHYHILVEEKKTLLVMRWLITKVT